MLIPQLLHHLIILILPDLNLLLIKLPELPQSLRGGGVGCLHRQLLEFPHQLRVYPRGLGDVDECLREGEIEHIAHLPPPFEISVLCLEDTDLLGEVGDGVGAAGRHLGD